MRILFKTTKLQKECNSHGLLVKKHGDRRALLIEQRIYQLKACAYLEDIRNVSGPRCHELIGNLKGILSADLDHPYRLLFEPADDPIPLKEDGGLDWTAVESIRILRVEDTHE